MRRSTRPWMPRWRGTYLESHIAGRRTDPELNRKIEEITRQYANSLPSRDELAALSKTYSVDFAALFFADRLLALVQSRTQPTLQRLCGQPTQARCEHCAICGAFRPRWDYVANGHLTV